MRKLWVFLFSVSLKYHNDVLAGRQIGENKNKKIWQLMNKNIYIHHVKAWKPRRSSCLMKEKELKVVMGGESSRLVDGTGAALDVGVPLIDQFPLISPLYMRLLLVKRRGGGWKTRVLRLTTGLRTSLLVDFCQLLEGASQRASFFKRQLGELVSFQRQRLLWIQLDYRYVSFQTSQ